MQIDLRDRRGEGLRNLLQIRSGVGTSSQIDREQIRGRVSDMRTTVRREQRI